MNPQTPPKQRRLEVENIGDVTVVNFTDNKILDEQQIHAIGEQLFLLVDSAEEGGLARKKVLLNFGNVDYMSSAALGKLVTLNRKLQRVNGKLVMCSCAPNIRETFEITRFDKSFKIVKDEGEALQLFD